MNTTKTALPTTVAFLTANNQLTVLAAALAPSVLGRPSRVSPKLRHYLGPAGEQGEITGLHYDFNKRYRIHTYREWFGLCNDTAFSEATNSPLPLRHWPLEKPGPVHPPRPHPHTHTQHTPTPSHLHATLVRTVQLRNAAMGQSAVREGDQTKVLKQSSFFDTKERGGGKRGRGRAQRRSKHLNTFKIFRNYRFKTKI